MSGDPFLTPVMTIFINVTILDIWLYMAINILYPATFSPGNRSSPKALGFANRSLTGAQPERKIAASIEEMQAELEEGSGERG